MLILDRFVRRYIPQIADDGGIDFNISHYEYVWDVNGVRQ